MKSQFSSSIVLTILALLASCGGSGSGGSPSSATKPQVNRPAEEQEEVIENQITTGTYRAFIRPLNTLIFGRLNSGLATFKVTKQEFGAHLYMDDLSSAGHMQTVYTGGKCPSAEDDLNKDGYLDILETMKVAGKMLLPLDAELSNQLAGSDKHPVGMTYEYKKNADLAEVLEDLKQADPRPEDELVKLRKDEELNLDGRVVVIQGVVNKNQLPTTVASVGSKSSYETIPVSCGLIRRVQNPQEN